MQVVTVLKFVVLFELTIFSIKSEELNILILDKLEKDTSCLKIELERLFQAVLGSWDRIWKKRHE